MRNLPEIGLIGGPTDGMVCIVTGPTSGIGKEAATELARRGAHGKDFPHINSLHQSLITHQSIPKLIITLCCLLSGACMPERAQGRGLEA